MKVSKLHVEPELSLLLADIRGILKEQGVKSYLVGGILRDLLLKRETADIDIAVYGDALKIAPRLASRLGGRYVQLDKSNGVGRIILSPDNEAAKDKVEIDIATLKGEIENDLFQRDFTIDAMAIDLEDIPENGKPGTEVIIDPCNGRDDLSHHIIRAVSDTSFKSDAVRLIRAVRLAAELDFSIDDRTETLIRNDGHLIAGVASERTREELLRILNLPGSADWLDYLDRTGILTALIPEMSPTKGVSQPKIHVWDVFTHSIKTVAAVEFLLREGEWEYTDETILNPVPWSSGLSEHFNREVSHGSTRKSLLKLAALLHDIAKPETKTIDKDGRARFLGHPQEGAFKTAGITERLRFSTKESKLVELMVNYHLRPTQMSHEELPSRRAIYRYFRDTGETGIDILFLCMADHLATRGRHLDSAQWQQHARVANYVLTKNLEDANLSVPVKLIDGNNLMETFNLEPGRRVGELLEVLKEAQAAGEVTTKQQGLDYIKHLISEQVKE